MARRDRVHRRGRARPVAHLDLVLWRDLVDVAHGGPVSDREADRLTDRRGQSLQVGMGQHEQVPPARLGRREVPDGRPEAIARIGLAGDGAGPFQRLEEARDRALGEAGLGRDLRDADRSTGDDREDREGALDRTDLRRCWHERGMHRPRPTDPHRTHVLDGSAAHREALDTQDRQRYARAWSRPRTVPRYGTQTMTDANDIDLSALSDEELVKQMHDDLYDGLAPEIFEGTNILLQRGWPADRVLNDALVEGMRIVGIDFRDGILFVPEVLLAANAMKAGMEVLRPLLAETGAERSGTVVIGTVKGDIHDIGKNLVAMMLEGAGFDVIDLGINNRVEDYLAALEEHQPDILGMRALLTTTMPYMKVVIDELEAAGLRERVHRARGRRTAERGVRQGGGRRRLLPRRRGGGRDRAGARDGQAGGRDGVLARVDEADVMRKGSEWQS